MRRAVLTLLAISTIWGSTWIPNQYLEGQGTPCALAALRYAVAALILAIVATLIPQARASTWRPSLTLGVTMLGVPVLLMAITGRHGAGAWTPLLYAALPLGLSIAAGELQFAAIAGAGAMFLLLNGSLPLTSAKLFWTLPTAAAVALQGWSLLYARKHLQTAAAPAGIVFQFATASIVLGAASLVLEAPVRLAHIWPTSGVLALAALAIVATALAYPLYYRLLAFLAPSQITTSQWLQTLVSVAEGAYLLRQRPGWMMLASSITLVGCTHILLRDQTTGRP
jgi:probable blue pigment (indigoidine) exporter